MSIHVRGLQKTFGKTVVCDHIDLDIDSGELVALLGPSGSGKTTLLRIIAGLEVPDAGNVRFHGADATFADVRERNVGFVFQHYALFNHMSVFENVAFGLRVKPRSERPSDAEIRRRVMDLLKLVQLDWVADRVVVMNQGRIEQVGTPDEVYDHPATPFVLQFVGDVNLFHGRGEVGYVRPHELEVLGAPTSDAWPATLSQTLTVGGQTRLEFEREGHDGPLDVQLPREEYRLLRDTLNLDRGSRVWLRPRHVRRFAPADAAEARGAVNSAAA